MTTIIKSTYQPTIPIQVAKIHLTAEKLIEYIKENRQEFTKKG